MMIHCAILRPPYSSELDLLATQFGTIHGLTQHLDSQLARLLERTILIVILLEEALGGSVVGTDRRGFPTAIVTTGVGLVELEVAVGIPAGVDEGDAEGPQAAVLCVTLLEVTKAAHQLLAGDVSVVGEEVALRGLAGVVDKDVRVGRHASDGAEHVAVFIQVCHQYS